MQLSSESLVLIAFLLTVLVSRLMVKLMWGIGVGQKSEPKIAGIQIHHFTYGLVLLVISGYFSITVKSDSSILPVLFGIGMGLLIDELYALLRILSKYWFVKNAGGETYYSRQSYVIMAITAAVLAILAIRS